MLTSTHILATALIITTCGLGWLALRLAEEKQRSGLYRHRWEATQESDPVTTVSREATPEDCQP